MENEKEKEFPVGLNTLSRPLPPRRFSSHTPTHTHTHTREVMRNHRPGSAPSMAVSHLASDHDDVTLTVREYTNGGTIMFVYVGV